MSATATPLPSGAPRVQRLSLVAATGRLLRLELRRNAMLWMVPLVVALFFLDAYRTAIGFPALWGLRASVIPNHLLSDFAPFVAGAAAWVGSRDGRRHTTDLVTISARPRWAAQLITWVATTCWAMAIYLGCVAVLYGVTAYQTTWGGPLWWPVAVGVAAVAAFSAVGFAAGAFFPSRFTAPLVALGVELALAVVSRVAVYHTGGYTLISPVNAAALSPDAGIFYPYLSDLSIVQVMFFGGLAVAALGALGLPGVSGGRRRRRSAAAVTVVGLLAVGTALGLAGTSRLEAQGVVIPTLHDGASERPTPFTPVRSRGAILILLQPAFRAALPAVAAALDPVLRELADLPGAPVRLEQVAPPYLDPTPKPTLSGSPLVFSFTVPPDLFKPISAIVDAQMRLWLVDSVIGGGMAPPASLSGGPAQQAVEIALLKVTGVPLPAARSNYSVGGVPLPSSKSGGAPAPAPGSPIYVASQRFAALPAAARHAWLAAHLTALQVGKVTLAQVP